jgi:predicted heme/steroid binding protein
MGFFRDLARIKARNRRMGNSKALIPGAPPSSSSSSGLSKSDLKMLFLGHEHDDPLKDVEIEIDANGRVIRQKHLQRRDQKAQQQQQQQQQGDRSQEGVEEEEEREELTTDLLVEYTREELYEYGNGSFNNNSGGNAEDYVDNDDSGTLLLAMFGRVYDVSAGRKFYGKNGKYNNFAGRDVTRALSTGCLAASCLGPKESRRTDSTNTSDSEIDGQNSSFDFELTPKAVAEGKKWLAFFETHDSYHLVGFLQDGKTIDDLIDEQLKLELMEN